MGIPVEICHPFKGCEYENVWDCRYRGCSFLPSGALVRFESPDPENQVSEEEPEEIETQSVGNDSARKIKILEETIAKLRSQLERSKKVTAQSQESSIPMQTRRTTANRPVQSQKTVESVSSPVLDSIEMQIAKTGYVSPKTFPLLKLENAFELIDSKSAPNEKDLELLEKVAKTYTGTIKPFDTKEIIEVLMSHDFIEDGRWVGALRLPYLRNRRGL